MLSPIKIVIIFALTIILTDVAQCDDDGKLNTAITTLKILFPEISIASFVVPRVVKYTEEVYQNITHTSNTGTICDKTDNDCTIKAANSTTHLVIRKKQLDPSFKKHIQGEASTLQYSFDDMLMFGLSNCNVTQSSFNTKEQTNEMIMDCPKFLFTSSYQVHGSIGNATLQDVKGKWALSAKQIKIIFNSNYTEETKDNNKTYIYYKDSNTKATVSGEVKIEKDIYVAGTQDPNTNKNFNEDQKLARELAEQLVVAMVQEFINDVNAYMKSHSSHDTFSHSS